MLLLTFAARAFPASPAIGFEENKGQYPQEVAYASRAGVSLIGDRFVLTQAGLSFQLAGADPASTVRPGDTLAGQMDLIGPSTRRITDIRQYASVRRPNVFPGIDATFTATDGGYSDGTISFGLTVRPGANLSDIRIRIAGARSLSTSRSDGGTMQINGAPIFFGPRASQGAASRAARYTIAGDTVSIAVDEYDPARELSILLVGTRGAGIFGQRAPLAASSSGGYFESGTVKQVLPPFADDLAVVSRSAAGVPQRVIILTGTGKQAIRGTAVRKPWFGKPDEVVYIAGITESRDFPVTANAARKDYGRSFVAAVDAAAGTLLYSTFLRDTGEDGNWTVRVDAASGLYVAGPLFVTEAAYATVIDLSTGAIRFQTRLPGSVNAADVDPAGRVYFTGHAGPDFPVTAGAYRTTPPATSAAFAARLTANGSLDYATWLDADRRGFAIAADSRGRAWITLVDRVRSGYFLARLDTSGASLTPGPPLRGHYLFVDSADNLVLVDDNPSGPHLVAKFDTAAKLVLERAFEPYAILGVDANNDLAITQSDGSVAPIGLAPSPAGWSSGSYNAASWNRLNAVAPGEIISLLGAGMGPAEGVAFRLDSQNRVPTLTGGTRVLFNGVPSPVLYAQANQVNTIVPFSVQPGSSLTIQVEYQGQRLAPLPTRVSPMQPGIFTLDGKLALALNQDGTLNGDSNPARPGEVVTIFANGLGSTTPASSEGAVATSISPVPVAPYNLYFFGPPEILYVGPSPGSLSSITQFNLRVPASLANLGSDVVHPALSLTAADEGFISQTLWIAVRP